MTWANFCCTFQAVVWVTPSRRASSRLEIPFFDWVIRYIAWNQMVSGKLVEWKMVPAAAALVQFSPLDLAAAFSPAARADEPLRPTPGEQRRPTLVLAPVGFTKLPLAEPFLKLNLIACHGEPPEKTGMFTFLYHAKSAEDSA